MTAFTPDLSLMRAQALVLMPDTCAVQRETEVRDATTGELSLVWATIATVPCRYAPASYRAGERVIAEQLHTTNLWTITLPWDTAVLSKDRLVISGRTFEVIGVDGPHSWIVALKVTTSEVL